MRTIRLGSRGPDVQTWQRFLRGTQCDANGECTVEDAIYAIVADGIFGSATEKATKAWQASQALSPDGIVGPHTWAEAIKDGFPDDAVPSKTDDNDEDVDPDPDPEPKPVPPAVDKTSPKWPPRPADAKPLTANDARAALFGKFKYVSDPTAKNPERIRITDGWATTHIAKFTIPQLSSKPISMHVLAGPQFVAWFKVIEALGLSDRVLSYAGCWVPRYVRGSKKTLSNHAWGSAIDINVPWNNQGKQAALVGKKGSVRELAEIGYDFGIFWGGHYAGSREDGMHFELYQVLTSDEITAALAKYGVVG